MAGALFGGAFLSASLQVLFDRIASREVVNFIKGKKLSSSLVKKLEITLLSVNAVLDDAEAKQFRDKNVKKWLEKLKDAVYEAEDLLDEVSTEALQSKLEAESQTKVFQVKNFFSSYNPFDKGMNSKLEEVHGRLEHLAKQKDALGLREGVAADKASQKIETTSFVDESGVYGRDDEKASIIKLLQSDDASGDRIGVIALVGMGGSGKTTLAQLVYNDNRVKDLFELKAWVCVSEEFDVFRVTKVILEAVTRSTCDINDLNRLQATLMENLMEKKFLLVLDDVWNQNYIEWERLRTTFNVGAPGSKIIVTTRNESVAAIMRTIPLPHLNLLTEEDCWLLFARHAFGSGDSGRQPTLERTGRAIVKRCRGLPLAAKTLGGLLRSKSTPEEWDNILKSEIWEFSDDESSILPALKISYLHLPSHLKRCFAYCSIFPKDYKFKKEQLIPLWMAENLLRRPSNNKRMEEVGDQCFNDLISRSFFQRSSGDKCRYIMHDLIHDLAKFVSGELCFWIEDDNSHSITEKTRHLSYYRTARDAFKKFEGICGATRLRTFLPLESYGVRFCLSNKVWHNLLPTLRCLRVLSLAVYPCVTEVPESIGNLKLLRHLDLSGTKIIRLPDSTTTLYNLQMLKLSDCASLFELPADMHKLINLCHLDLTGTNIKRMPVHMGKLKCLQTLTLFSVGEQSGTNIRELRQLNDLRGGFSILELQNVIRREDALEASLKTKKHLEKLVSEWSTDSGDSQKERCVLQELQPHTNLKELTIKNYGGAMFPIWLGDKSFSNIVLLCLRDCKYCVSLPPLGQLHSLKELSVIGLYGVVTVGEEFYGHGDSTIKPFMSLETLSFRDMLELEEWFPFEGANEGGTLSSLKELCIENCPKLTKELPNKLPSLTKLVISECRQLVALLPKASALSELCLEYCDKFLLKELPPKLERLSLKGWSLPERLKVGSTCLHELSIFDCTSLDCLPMDNLSSMLIALHIKSCPNLEFPVHLHYPSLRTLTITGSCYSLKSFPLDIFPNLKFLHILDCMGLESLSTSLEAEHDLTSLIHLFISKCPKFVSLLGGGLRAPNLTRCVIDQCESLKLLPEGMHTLLPSLTQLNIVNCPELVSFPEGGLPSNLRGLQIVNCAKLFANRQEWYLQRLTSLEGLLIYGEDKDMDSFLEEELLPTTLTSLSFSACQHLQSLNSTGLRQLTNLQNLEIYGCPKIQCLPEESLPNSLSFLSIRGCPSLKNRCRGEGGEDWHKISHIRCIRIDDEIFP